VSFWNREQTDRLRAIPLAAVLPLCGGEPDRCDKHKWRTPAGTLSVCGPKFMNWSRGIGGGGAIDLVIHLKNLGFPEAVDWLAGHFAGHGPLAPAAAASRSPLRLPPPDSGKLERVKAYLALQRAIPKSTIEALIGSGALYADARANAVFLLWGKANRPVGAELRGTTERSWRGMAPGSRKDLGFFAIGPEPAPTVVLCESAIDALSCFTLHPAYRCVSTSGARPDPPWLASLLAHASQLYCGFDADPTGERMADEMIAHHPAVKRLRPALKDWNDLLRPRR
jgi:hypothetical protein